MSEMNWLVIISKHWGKILGGLLGLIFALLVINYGLGWSVFIFLCIGLGLLIGWKLDLNNDVGASIRRFFSKKDDLE